MRDPLLMRASSRVSAASVTSVFQTLRSASVWLRYLRTFPSRTARGTAAVNGLVAPIWCL
jgi:hypothetical protein